MLSYVALSCGCGTWSFLFFHFSSMLPAIGATCFPEKSGDSEEASFFSVHQHIHPPSIYLYIYLSIRMSTHASICPSTHHPPIHSSTYLLTHLPTFPSIHPSIYPSIPTSLHLPIYLAVHQFIYVSTHLSSILHSLAHPSVHQSISSPVHSSINLPTINLSIHTSVVYLPIPHISIHQPHVLIEPSMPDRKVWESCENQQTPHSHI